MGQNVVRTLENSPGVGGITGFDPKRERLEELKKEFGVKTTQTLDEVLQNHEIKLVFITASNNAHKDLAVAALEAGKAVMCEKPMATTIADAEAMVKADRKSTRLNSSHL